MAPRKAFLLRVSPSLLKALERWAGDEFRSLNGQIEYLLRDQLRRAGRPVIPDEPESPEAGNEGSTRPPDTE